MRRYSHPISRAIHLGICPFCQGHCDLSLYCWDCGRDALSWKPGPITTDTRSGGITTDTRDTQKVNPQRAP